MDKWAGLLSASCGMKSQPRRTPSQCFGRGFCREDRSDWRPSARRQLRVPGAPTVLWPSDALIGASRGRREPVFLGITWPLPARAEGRWVGSTGVEGCDWVLGSNRRDNEESEISHCRKMLNFFGLFVCFLPCQTTELFFPQTFP